VSIRFIIFKNDMKKSAPSIRFHFQTPCSLANRTALKVFIVSIFRKEKKLLSGLDIVFCNDEYLLTLNQRFLRHNFYTDILGFPLSSPGDPITAEIYISVDRVRDNAANLQESLKEELHRVIFHGILHLCGHKDKSKADILNMRALEGKYLNAYFGKKSRK
jgi:probable rRNA maturation factor